MTMRGDLPQTVERGRGDSSLVQTIDVETPELVVFSYTIAGVGSRALAALVDSLIVISMIIAIGIGVSVASVTGRVPRGSSPGAFDAWASAIFIFAVFCVLWGYYVLFEGLADGQTPGKRLLRLRVVRDGGYSVTFGASAVRNLIRVIDMQPLVCYGVGIVSVMFSKSGKRLGDIVAGTIVVREALVKQLAPASPQITGEPPRSFDTALTEDEYAVLERFMERRGSLDAERRTALATQLAARLTTGLSDAAVDRSAGTTDLARLVRLYEAERDARARGVAARRERGAARERNVIVATRSPRWTAFAATLAEAQKRGLRALGESGVRDFVSEYRDLASDLARLRTAAQGRETPELFYLSRLLAGAHNLLYRGRTATLADVVRVITVEAPREVRRSWRPILLAATLLFGPAVIAYSAVVRQPAVAATFIPSGMLDRAEEGVRRAREGTGYIPDPEIFRPTMASQIIANNIQVTFGVFALGLTAGVGSLLLLVLNGVSFGGVLGLYQSKGIARLILAFVAPHGVLELSAVCIAGGAGFLLAAALLLPGRRTRRRALVDNGARAIRLIAAATVLLLVAGTLEGFVSPIPSWPLEAKLAVSGATLVLLALYLASGRERPSKTAPEEAAPETAGELLSLAPARR
jgi:uncharacterized membrane protein SpoIIM required for sporulation/uncharacterized RDD family membrane protein YckC